MRRLWWLAALPLAAAFMLGASAYRVESFWYVQGPHDLVDEAGPGEWATLTEDFRDAEGETSRTVRVRFDGLGDAPVVAPSLGEPGPPPEGTRAVHVRLSFEADPDQELRGCSLELVDREGVVYQSGTLDGDPLQQPEFIDRCLPPGREGPASAGFKGQERGVVAPGTERPQSWTTRPVVLIAEDAEIVAARVYFTYPEYVELAAPAD